jgi:hypothetical protein
VPVVAAIEFFAVSRSAGVLMREWSLTRAKVSGHLLQDAIPELTCRPYCRSCMQFSISGWSFSSHRSLLALISLVLIGDHMNAIDRWLDG